MHGPTGGCTGGSSGEGDISCADTRPAWVTEWETLMRTFLGGLRSAGGRVAIASAINKYNLVLDFAATPILVQPTATVPYVAISDPAVLPDRRGSQADLDFARKL